MKIAHENGLFTGKLPARNDPRTLKFEKYLDTSVIDLSGPPPDKTPGHANMMPTPRLMLGNGPDDTVQAGFQGAGDCVFAMTCNLFRLAWAIAGKGTFPANGATAIGGYSEVTGYVINDQSTDQGTDMTAALNWLRKIGIKDLQGNRHQIGAFAAIDISNWNHLLWALYLADTGAPVGINFPASAMAQFDANEPWTPVKGSPSDGGHCILVDEFLAVETWARDEPTVQEFLTEYMDEAYFVITPEATLPSGNSMEGIAFQDLLSDAAAFSTAS